MEVLEETESICPECFRQKGELEKVDAEIVEEGGKVWIKKECPEHGEFKSIYFSNPDDYRKWRKYGEEGDGVENVEIEDLSLYDDHKSQSVLTNLTVTNRCNLRCSYCFLNAGASGYVYEPSLDKIRELIKQARNIEPVPSKAIQITGGEPTVRDDIFEIIEMAKEEGFEHVQLNTNGIKLAESEEFCRKLVESPVDTVYMSFDGVTEDTNPWIEENKEAIENLREAGFRSAVLVPVAMQDNLHELGKIIEYAKENIDVIRGVNFQPIAFTGRIDNIDEDYRKNQRVDYSEMMNNIDEQLDGKLTRDDWYPVPFVYPISKLLENVKEEKQVEFTAHPGCGGGTYIFLKDGEILPITRFVDVEGLMEFVHALSEKDGRLKKARIATSVMRNIGDYIDEDKAPDGFSMKKILANALIRGNYDSLGEFHYKSLYVGTMWFQDVWNLNIDRLSNCVIHYTTEEGMVPFCAYNGIGIGEDIRERHAVPVEEWEEKTGKSLKDDLWENGPIS